MAVGVGNGYAVDFSSTASKGYVGARVELKICEWCGRQFIRLAPLQAKVGQKVCDPCWERQQEVVADGR